MPRGKRAEKSTTNGANLGFEEKLWLAADELRNNMDSGEYKHVVFGLVFLKYISDAFEEHYHWHAEPWERSPVANKSPRVWR